MALPLYYTEDHLIRLQGGEPTLPGRVRTRWLVEAAWAFRERDSRLALEYAAEADRTLAKSADEALSARLALARADIHALFNDLPASEAALAVAQAFYSASNDIRSLCDVCLSQAVQAIARGDTRRASESCREALRHARQSGDDHRVAVVHAWIAYFQAYSEPREAIEEADALRREHPLLSDDLLALVNAAEAAATFWSDPARSLMAVLRARQYGEAAGLRRLAIMASVNAGWILEVLGDFESALECIEWAVSQARSTGWPTATAASMVRLGSVLCELGEYERSEEVLGESMAGLERLQGSLHRAIAMACLGQLHLRQGRKIEAVAAYRDAVNTFRRLKSADNLVDAVIQLARALSVTGDVDGALKSLEEAKALIYTHGFAERAVALHQAEADIHAQYELPLPPNVAREDVRAYFLDQAMAAGRTIEAWQPSTALLLASAEAHHARGALIAAYDYMRDAMKSAQSHAHRQAANRSIMLQARHETESARAEAAHHRELADTLSRQSHTLEELGRIGQEITAHLDETSVIDTLGRHVGTLADAPHLAVWLLNDTRDTLELRHGVEDGKPLPRMTVALDEPKSLAAACIREAREILVEETLGTVVASIPGTRALLTAFFAPLTVAGRIIGALTIQSAAPKAFGERELLIFRTLGTYAAIALDNTRAYQELKLARARLEEASLTDPLTGLRNRRFLHQYIASDVALTQRAYAIQSSEPSDLIFLLVDIDHFKQVNDRHGHGAGDAVLMEMRNRLSPLFRATDHLVRWGGEEFLVVARATTRERVAELAERVCNAVRTTPFALPDGTHMQRTCSVGAACLPFDPRRAEAFTWQDVLDLADQALYAVKQSGRDGWAMLSAAQDAAPLSANIRNLHLAVSTGQMLLTGSRDAASLGAALQATQAEN